MSRTGTPARATRRAPDNRIILDPFRLEARLGCRSAKLDHQDVALLRTAWDHRGEPVVVEGAAMGNLCSKLHRCLDAHPIHEKGGRWSWDGTDRLVELATCTL